MSLLNKKIKVESYYPPIINSPLIIETHNKLTSIFRSIPDLRFFDISFWNSMERKINSQIQILLNEKNGLEFLYTSKVADEIDTKYGEIISILNSHISTIYTWTNILKDYTETDIQNELDKNIEFLL